MVNIDQLRHRQEQRLLPVIAAWDEAKKHLENAIALAEARERDFRGVSEDVRRNLDALLLVTGMAKEAGSTIPAERNPKAEENQPALRVAESLHKENLHKEKEAMEEPETGNSGLGGLLRRSSRPLFSSLQRSA